MIPDKTNMKNLFRIFCFLLFILICTFSFAQKALSVYSYANLKERIENNSDTLYIVNFWATWCKPCVAELPDFEKADSTFKTKKVKVLLISMDFKEDIEKRVVPFLQKNNYKSETIILDETDGSFIDKISTSWSGAIPATLFIRNNKREFFGKKLNYEFLLQKTEELSQ